MTRYSADLRSELEDQGRRGRQAEDAPARLAERRAAIDREEQFRVAELRQKSALRVSVRMLQLLLIEQPKLLVKTTVTAPTGMTSGLEMVWDPLTEAVEAIPCPTCQRPGYSFEFTRQGQLVCSACVYGPRPAVTPAVALPTLLVTRLTQPSDAVYSKIPLWKPILPTAHPTRPDFRPNYYKLNMPSTKHALRVYRWNLLGIIALGCALFGDALCQGQNDRAPAQAAPDSTTQAFTQRVRPILQKHCFACHAGKKVKGDLDLDKLAPDFQPAETAKAWEKVGERLASHSMPPKSKPQPSAEEAKALHGWVEAGLAAADTSRQRTEGRAIIRRLSRAEYVNTIRDLLAVDVELKELLPEDLPAPHGFENDALALRVSSVLIERYMEAADVALKAALVHGPRPVTSKVKLSYKNERLYNLAKMDKTVAELDNAVVLLSDKTLGLSQFQAKTAGRYRFRVSAYAFQNNGRPMVMAVHARPPGPGAAGLRALSHHAVPADKPAVIEFVVQLNQQEAVNLMPDELKKERIKSSTGPGYRMVWEVEGPLLDTWPPESYQRLLGNVAVKTATLADAERALRTFISRAFRRPASDELVRPYLEMVRIRLKQGYSFEDALRRGPEGGALFTAAFLFLESQPGPLDDFALAARLSYFLWSSMPDQELFDLAKKEKLCHFRCASTAGRAHAR